MATRKAEDMEFWSAMAATKYSRWEAQLAADLELQQVIGSTRLLSPLNLPKTDIKKVPVYLASSEFLSPSRPTVCVLTCVSVEENNSMLTTLS